MLEAGCYRQFVENYGKKFYSFICSNLLEAAQKGKEVKTQASRGFTDGQQKTLPFWRCYKQSSKIIKWVSSQMSFILVERNTTWDL